MSVRNSLLGLLAQRPRHGYELHDAFEAMLGGQTTWDVKPAQIYSTLARLAEAGLIVEEGVEQEGGPEKRIFAVTDAGRLELQQWFAEPVISEHERDEVFLKLMLSVSTGVADPQRVVATQRASLYRELHAAATRRGATDSRKDLAVILLLDQVVMHLEADLRWLEMVEQRLDDLRRQPPRVPEARVRGRPRKG